MSDFSNDINRPSGKHPYCKICVRVYGRQYAAKHREEAKARAATWYKEHPDQVTAYYADADVKARRRSYMHQYRKTHRDRKRQTNKAYEKHRQATDVNYRLAVSLRKRLGVALRNKQKAGSAVRDLGCTIPQLKCYLEQKFLPGMSWANHTRTGWHIDHIIPLASFELTDPEQFKRAVHYTNLQPLWASDNYIKGPRLSAAPQEI